MKLFLITILMGMVVLGCSPSPLSIDTPRRIISQDNIGRYPVPSSSLQLEMTDGGALAPWVLDYLDPLAVDIDTSVSPPAVWINRLHVADAPATGSPGISLVAVNVKADSLTVQSGTVSLIGDPDANGQKAGAALTLWLPVLGVLQKISLPCDDVKNSTTAWLVHFPVERKCVIHMTFSAQGNQGQANAIAASGLLTISY